MQKLTKSWAQPPNIIFCPNIHPEIKLSPNSKIFSKNPNDIKNCKTISDLGNKISLMTINKINIDNSSKFDSVMHIKKKIILENELFVNINKKNIYLKDAIVEGTIIIKKQEFIPTFKILTQLNENNNKQPLVGCAIYEDVFDKNIMAITCSNYDRSIRMINIPLTERSRKTLKNIKKIIS
jgi:hypothetical protein